MVAVNSTEAGRTPLLPLYALLLLSVPSEFTLRTLFEFGAFGHSPRGVWIEMS